MTSHSPGRRAASVVLALATATALSACTSDEAAPTTTETTASPTPTATPTPTEPPAPEVVGARATNWEAMPSAIILGQGANPQPDAEAVRKAIQTVSRWLDAHLTELHRDGTGLWGQMAVDGLAAGDERRIATTELASPERPVESARYDIDVYYAGAPEFMSVDVTVSHPTGTPSRVSLGFVVAPDGTPRLTMFGPAEQADES